MTGLYNSKRDARKQAKRLSGTVKKVLWYSKRGHFAHQMACHLSLASKLPEQGGGGGCR